MSYQPIQSPPPDAVRARRGGGLIWAGVVVFLIGVAAAVASWFTLQQRFDSKVTSLAEDSGALSGCITDLDFSKTGTFVLYYISEGDVRVNGDNDGCADEDVVEIDADTDPPDMELTLTDENGDDIRIGSTSLDEDQSVSAGGVTAWPYRGVEIEDAGEYQLEVIADDDADRFAIGVGPAIEEPSSTLPIVLGVIGLVAGLILVIVGITRRKPPAAPVVLAAQPAAQYQGPGQYPSGPPVTYNPPAAQGFDHPTQAMPPIAPTAEPLPPFDDTVWGVPTSSPSPLPPPPPPASASPYAQPTAPAGPPSAPSTPPAAGEPSPWAPVDATPADTGPSPRAPGDTIPADTGPSPRAPGDTIPDDAGPSPWAPVETPTADAGPSDQDPTERDEPPAGPPA